MKRSHLVLMTLSTVAVVGCSSSVAQPCGTHPVYEVSDHAGVKYSLTLDGEALMRSPSWSPEKGDPPLGVAKAAQLALGWAKSEYTRYDRVEISEVVLARTSCFSGPERWYYRFSFTPVIDGNHVYGMGNFVAVSMDGTVVAPTKSP